MEEQERQNQGIMQEIGVTGVPRMGGVILDEELADLRGLRRVKTIRAMIYNDPVIGALLFGLKMLIRQTRFRIDDASDSNEDMKAGEFIRGAFFDDMGQAWNVTAGDVVSFLPWGWAWHEICYKLRHGEQPNTYVGDDGIEIHPPSSLFNDGLIGWDKWPIRRQETLYDWIFDAAGDVLAMRQQASPDYLIREIPRTKSLLFQTESAGGNPEGWSILRNAYKPWKMKTRLELVEAIGVERDTAGLPVAYIPDDYMDPAAPAAKQAVLRKVQQIVTGIRQDDQGGVVMPMKYDAAGKKMFELELLHSGGTKQFDTDKIVNRYDQRILMSAMADFMLLGAEQHGSFALASDKTDLFAVAVGAWLDSIVSVVNTHAIPPLMRLNGMRAGKPKLAYKDIETRDLSELSAFVKDTTAAGLLTYDRNLEAWLREAADMPAMIEGEIEQ